MTHHNQKNLIIKKLYITEDRILAKKIKNNEFPWNKKKMSEVLNISFECLNASQKFESKVWSP